MALAEHLVQREVDHVRERVRLAHQLPPVPLDAALEAGPRRKAAFHEVAHVQHVPSERLHRAHLEG